MSDTKTIYYPDGDKLHVRRHQDVGDILEDNRESSKNPVKDLSFGRRVASIPNIIIEQWMKEGVNVFNMGRDPDVRKEVMKRLNSPEWRYLRTHNSRL